MDYAQGWLINYKTYHKIVDNVKCRSIRVLKVVGKAQRASSSLIDQFPRDWSIVFPRISSSSWFVTSSTLIASGWQAKINKWVILVSLKTRLKILWKWSPRLLMTKRGSSNWVTTHGMNFTRTIASLPFSLYNSAHSNAWTCTPPTLVFGTFFLKL